MSLIGKLLAAIVATLWGACLILAGALGIQAGGAAFFAVTGGVVLILLAADQAWRVIRKLG